MSDHHNYSDAPLENPEDDKLNFAPYAQTLAKAIANVPLDKGAVMAIYGEWGSGKSTLINFIQKYLKLIEKANPEQELVIIEFNPWLFSGQENLVAHFFDELQSNLSNKFMELSRKLRSYSSKVNDAVVYLDIPIVSPLLKSVGNLLGRKPPTISNLKSQIIKTLQENKNSRFLIIIDDVDRLYPEEIRQLFGLIKSVANFPNIIYLLAFDKYVVSQAISPRDDKDYGDDFLEKIVQTPFNIPIISKSDLDNLFYSQIQNIFFDEGGFIRRYDMMLRYFIDTPRDVTRFVNTLRFTYNGIREEVDKGDFLAIEILRVFRPQIYEIIKNNKNWFLGNIESGFRKFENLLQVIIDLEDSKTRNIIRELIKSLFPNAGHDTFGFHLQHNQMRICHPEHFETYFRYSLKREQISQELFKNFISLLLNNESQSLFFINLINDDIDKFRKFIKYLAYDQYIMQIPLESSKSIIKSLFEVADKSYESEKINSKELDFFSIYEHISSLVNKILRQHLHLNYHILVKQSIENAESLYLSVLLMWDLLEDRSFDKLAITVELRKLIVSRIRENIDSIDVEDMRLVRILRLWLFIEPNLAKEWLITNPQQLVKLLNSYFDISYSIQESLNQIYQKFENKELQEILRNIILNPVLNNNDKSRINWFLKVLQGEILDLQSDD